MTAACGFDVSLSFEGAATAQLFFDKDGVVVKEIDTAPGVKATLSSTSGSLSFPLATIHANYVGDGAGEVTLGSPVIVKLTGFSLSPRMVSSGQAVFEAVVTGFFGDFPINESVGPPIAFHGDLRDVQSICADLSV